LCFHEAGKPVRDFRKAWEKLTAAAGVPDLLLHDLRRSAARNLRNAGVPENVIMKIGGWRTRSVFERYSIIVQSDIQDTMGKLEAQRMQKREQAKKQGGQPLESHDWVKIEGKTEEPATLTKELSWDLCHDAPMRHNLPPTPAFRDSPPTDPIQEIALRVVVELPEWKYYVIGTAVVIGGYLAITAKHVLEAVIARFGPNQVPEEPGVGRYSLQLYQVLPGPVYRIWNVFKAWRCPSDIAILHLGLGGSSAPEAKIEWTVPLIRVLPPPSGQKVLAFGYRESKVEVSEGADGTHHIQFDDIGTTSIGEVGHIFPEQRDSVMLTFPCFEVYAKFAHGMSGGLVIDENGALCGLVCAGCELADPNAMPLSYAATLWPMLRTLISGDRGDAYPRGVEYPMIDLALDKIIHVTGLEELDPGLFPGRVLPRR